ncbi:MAG: peptide deformylase [Patescibacteria group bacterium]
MATKQKLSTLKRTEFGNPILRQQARELSKNEILSTKTQTLIKDMRTTLKTVKLGIGLAAPQVGEAVALSVIVIQPTKHRPDVEPFELVIINPKITDTVGRKKQLWEGCISSGVGKAGLFAKVPRYKKIKLEFNDQTGTRLTQDFEGLHAHVIQHEVDHLNGILFVDRVKSTKTFTTYNEYLKLQKSTINSKNT